jgi:hypothetical protein
LLTTGPVTGKISDICGNMFLEHFRIHAFRKKTKAAAALIDLQRAEVARELGVLVLVQIHVKTA